MSRLQDAMLENYNYWNDPRVVSSMTRKPKVSVDGEHVVYELGEDDDGEPIEVAVPTKRCVCPMCDGRGTTASPSIDAGGITLEDREQWSEDEWDFYIDGGYDITCPECKGRNVVARPDWSRISREDRERIEAWEREEREFAQMCAMERAMGC